MEENISVIAMLMVKYARQEELAGEERLMLEEWWDAAPENRALANRVADRDRLKNALYRRNHVPRRKMWREINRQLDEMEELTESGTAPVWRIERWVLRFGLGVMVLSLALCAGRLAFERVKNTEPVSANGNGVIAREKKSGVRKDAAYGPELLAAIPKERVLPVPGAAPPKAGMDILYEDSHAGAPSDAEGAPTSPVNQFVPAPVRRDTGSIFHFCRTVVASSSPDLPPAGEDGSYPYAFSANALQQDLGGREGPTEVHYDGVAPIRLAGTRRFENAAAAAPATRGPDPVETRGAFHFRNTELERVLAQVAERYGLKIFNPEGWKGTAMTIKLPQSAQPDSVLHTLQLLETGFVQLKLEGKLIVVSGWPRVR